MSSINNVNSGVQYYQLDCGSVRATANRFGTGAKVGNIKLPDYKNSLCMYTKTEPTKSDAEIKEELARIAKEDQKKGHFHSETKEYLELRKEYVSSVSPDRESIVANSTKEIFANANAIKQKVKEPPKNLLEVLIEMEKKGDKVVAINMNCPAYTACFEGDKLNYARFQDSNGEIVATYDPNSGWSCIGTKEEGVRLREFAKTYNEAWKSAEAEMKGQNSKAQPKHLEGGTAFDAYA